MPELKTNQPLLDALEKARKSAFTAEELDQQRVSFVMGSLKSDSEMTRARVEEILAQQEGRKQTK
jgi:hypothetical protein